MPAEATRQYRGLKPRYRSRRGKRKALALLWQGL
jgi:hypothetical protein